MRTHISKPAIDWYKISYTVSGFDRLNFVSDITDAIPQDSTCQIARLSFVSDGIQAKGQLTIRVQQPQRSNTIHNRLQAVEGIVSVRMDQPLCSNA